MNNKLPRGTLVEVTWFDAESNPCWTDLADIDKAEPPRVKTVGYYRGCHKTGSVMNWIILNHSIHGCEQADYTLIPYGCVLSMEKVG